MFVGHVCFQCQTIINLTHVALQVHISQEFLSWLQLEYPFVKLNLIPAGCTSKVQIADICLNRPFKVCMKKAFMNHATNDVLQQVTVGVLV